MIQLFVKNDLFTSVHFSFRSNHSFAHAITEIISYVMQSTKNSIDAIDTGQICFIDIRKAIDSLDHSQLLNKV